MDAKVEFQIEYIRRRLLTPLPKGTDKSDLLMSIYKEMEIEGYSNQETYIIVNEAVMRNMIAIFGKLKRG